MKGCPARSQGTTRKTQINAGIDRFGKLLSVDECNFLTQFVMRLTAAVFLGCRSYMTGLLLRNFI